MKNSSFEQSTLSLPFLSSNLSMLQPIASQDPKVCHYKSMHPSLTQLKSSIYARQTTWQAIKVYHWSILYFITLMGLIEPFIGQRWDGTRGRVLVFTSTVVWSLSQLFVNEHIVELCTKCDADIQYVTCACHSSSCRKNQLCIDRMLYTSLPVDYIFAFCLIHVYGLASKYAFVRMIPKTSGTYIMTCIMHHQCWQILDESLHNSVIVSDVHTKL